MNRSIRWRQLVAAPLIALALGGWVSKDEAFKDLPLGKKVSNPFSIGDVQVPLPEGEWVVAGRRVSESTASGAAFTTSATLASVILVDVAEKKMRSAIMITTPLDYGTTARWNKARECSRQDMLFSANDELPQIYSHFCWWTNHRRFSFDGEWAKRDHIKEMMSGFAANGIPLPGNTLTTGFEMAVGQKYIYLTYDRNPEIEDISRSRNIGWSESDWHKNRIHEFPDKLQYVEKMKAWAAEWKEKVKQGFHKKF